VPYKQYPLRWKDDKELLGSCATVVLTAMDVEESAVNDAIHLPKEMTHFFLPCTIKAVVGLIGESPVPLMRTRNYGSDVREPLYVFYWYELFN